jgi:hypothetical protein
MPHMSTVRSHQQRRAAPRCRGGASSLLRLSNVSTRRLPSCGSLADWMSRAASPLSDFGGLDSDLIVHLQPSTPGPDAVHAAA